MSAPDRAALPAIAPDVLAVVTDRAPPRLLKKLDAAPDVAAGWSFEVGAGALDVATDTGDRVTVRHDAGVVRDAEAMGCSCLLAPRCFHVLAVASWLRVAREEVVDAPARDEVQVAAAPLAPSGASTAPDPPRAPPTSTSQPDAKRARVVLERVLETGLVALGALDRAALLREVHAARVVGLHRLATRMLTVAEAGRALRERSPTFELEQATRAFGDAAVTAHRLERGSTERDVVGTARRAYEDVGAKRFVGVACEPVVTRSGYAGVVTYLLDDAGELFTVNDVAPGDARRALASYRATVRLGEASLTHGELSRGGLFVQGATASADRRLGAGARVSAVSAAGATFDEEPLAPLFRRRFGEQVARALAAGDQVEGPALVFLRGTLVGPAPGGAFFAIEAHPGDPTKPAAPIVTLAMSSAEDVFACNENARLLRAAVGTRLAVVGKVSRRRPRVVEALAIGGVEGSLALAEGSKGKVQLAFEKLARGHLRPATPAADATAITALLRGASSSDTVSIDPVGALERRVARMVLGGRRSLTSSASREVATEAAALSAALLPTARRALEELLAASAGLERSPGSSLGLLDAWMRAHVVARSLRATLARSGWGLD